MTAWVDRDGDVWRPVGRDAQGELILACTAPRNPEDQGEGDSFPWTLSTIEMWFGPLTEVSLEAYWRECRLDEQRHQVLDPAEPDPAAYIAAATGVAA